MEMFIFISIVILAMLLLLCYLIAKQFEEIANEKGYPDTKYFWFSFWLLPIGIAMVIALPDKYARPEKIVQIEKEKREKEFNDEELPDL